MSEMILALYDCRSKQEYIYRTNRIKEITGGSQLLTELYDNLKKQAIEKGIRFADGGEWKNREFCFADFESSDNDAAVVYDGGGNMMTVYKNKDIMVKVNKLFSDLLHKKLFTVSAVFSCTPVTGDFIADRAALYAKNAVNKNIKIVSQPYAVLPFTQVDMRTYMPIVEKNRSNQQSFSCESLLKRQAYQQLKSSEAEKEKQMQQRSDAKITSIYLDDLVTEKGKESLLAIIYIDGNAMGAKLQELDKDSDGDYDSCINKLRQFSVRTNEAFVEKPIQAIEDMLWSKNENYAKYRKVIAGGDEITLICNARMVPEILDVYFKTLDSKNTNNYACAGVALFHSHAPFAQVYKIAEQCCESGKKQSRAYDSNADFVDFHFCRSAITNDMDTVREKQEAGLTARPYRIDDEHGGYSYNEFEKLGKMLSVIGRANIKNLAAAIIKGDAHYQLEMQRIRSRYKDTFDGKTNEQLKQYIFDIAQVYDLWFAVKEG